MRCERGTLLPLLPSKPTVQHTQHLLVKILATVTEICTHEPAPDGLTPTSFNAVETPHTATRHRVLDADAVAARQKVRD